MGKDDSSDEAEEYGAAVAAKAESLATHTCTDWEIQKTLRCDRRKDCLNIQQYTEARTSPEGHAGSKH